MKKMSPATQIVFDRADSVLAKFPVLTDDVRPLLRDTIAVAIAEHGEGVLRSLFNKMRDLHSVRGDPRPHHERTNNE